MDKIIEMLNEINNDKNNIVKYDLVCALGGIVSLLQDKIESVEKLRFNPLIPINGLGFYKEYRNGLLMGVRQIMLVKFDYLENEYIFKIGNDKSNDRLIISGNLYPMYKDNQDNIVSEITSV